MSQTFVTLRWHFDIAKVIFPLPCDLLDRGARSADKEEEEETTGKVNESELVPTWIQYKHGVILLLEQMTAFVSLKSLIVTIQKVVNKYQDVVDSFHD